MNELEREVVVKVVSDTVRRVTAEHDSTVKALHDRIDALNEQIVTLSKQPGPVGKSAYDIAVSKGFDGDELAWLASLHGKDGQDGKDGEKGLDGPQGLPGEKGEKGERGEKGEKGDAGERGERGEKGLDGEQGIPGEKGEKGERGIGEKGEKGIDGKDGRDGREGKDGRDGIDGRDALEIEIIDGFDVEKNYHKGTFAIQDNGLWRFGNTGWKCLIAGIKDVDIQMTDERTFTVTQERTDGKKDTKEFHVPALVYREVWKDGGAYEAGDVVTHDGSMWVCLKPTKSRPGQFSKEWRLSVKKGRNGKS